MESLMNSHFCSTEDIQSLAHVKCLGNLKQYTLWNTNRLLDVLMYVS